MFIRFCVRSVQTCLVVAENTSSCYYPALAIASIDQFDLVLNVKEFSWARTNLYSEPFQHNNWLYIIVLKFITVRYWTQIGLRPNLGCADPIQIRKTQFNLHYTSTNFYHRLLASFTISHFFIFIHKCCKVLCKGKSNFSCFHNQYRGQVRWAERVGVSDVWPGTVSLSVVMAWDGCRHNMAVSQWEEGTLDYSPSTDSTGRRVSAPARDRQNSTCHVKLLWCSRLMSRTGSNKKNRSVNLNRSKKWRLNVCF